MKMVSVKNEKDCKCFKEVIDGHVGFNELSEVIASARKLDYEVTADASIDATLQVLSLEKGHCLFYVRPYSSNGVQAWVILHGKVFQKNVKFSSQSQFVKEWL